MLIRNNEIFNPRVKKDKDPHGQHASASTYMSLKEDVKRTYGDLIRFIRPNVYRKNSSGLMEPVPHMTINLEASRSNIYGDAEYWLYSAQALPLKKDGVFYLDRTAIIMGADLILSVRDDMDLIFFLMTISEQYKRGEFIIDDPKAVARKDADTKRTAAAINTALYGELSPLSNDERLKDVAASWGLANIGSKSGDQIRLEFEVLLVDRDKQKKRDSRVKGTKDFIASLGNIDDEMRKRALIRRGLDRKAIEYKGKIFKFVVTATDDELLFVPSDRMANKFDYLCDYMFRESNINKWNDIKKTIIDGEYIDGISKMEDIRWLCKEESINQKQKTLDSLKSELKEIYT